MFIRWTCRWDSVDGTAVDVSGALRLQLHSQLPSRILNTVFAFIRKHHFSFGDLSSLNVTTCSVSTYPTSYRSPKVQPQQRHFVSSSVAPLLSNYNNHSTFILLSHITSTNTRCPFINTLLHLSPRNEDGPLGLLKMRDLGLAEVILGGEELSVSYSSS